MLTLISTPQNIFRHAFVGDSRGFAVCELYPLFECYTGLLLMHIECLSSPMEFVRIKWCSEFRESEVACA